MKTVRHSSFRQDPNHGLFGVLLSLHIANVRITKLVLVPDDRRRELRLPRVPIVLQPLEAPVAVNFPIDALLVPTLPQVVLFHWDPVALFLLEEVLELIADLRRAILTARSRWQPRLVFDEDVTVCIKMTCAHIGVGSL